MFDRLGYHNSGSNPNARLQKQASFGEHNINRFQYQQIDEEEESLSSKAEQSKETGDLAKGDINSQQREILGKIDL